MGYEAVINALEEGDHVMINETAATEDPAGELEVTHAPNPDRDQTEVLLSGLHMDSVLRVDGDDIFLNTIDEDGESYYANVETITLVAE